MPQTQAALNQAIDDIIKVAPVGTILDENKLQGANHRILLKEIVQFVTEQASVPPLAPDGVSFISEPGVPIIAGENLTETSCSVLYNGDTISVPTQVLSIPLAGTGSKRKDAIVVNYQLTPTTGNYERITGTEVLEISTLSPTPVIPENRLFVRYVDVTDGIVTVGVDGNSILSLSYADGGPVSPDGTGNVNLSDVLPDFIEGTKQDSMAYDGTGTKIPTVDAVNIQTKHLATVAVHTGFIRTDDSFTLSAPTTGTLGIAASQYGVVFSSYFTTALTAPIDAVKNLTARTVTLNATNLGAVAPADGYNTILYVGWAMPSDTIVFGTAPYIQAPGVCQLGVIFVKNSSGTYTFTDATRTFINMPDVSAYSNLLTTTTGVKSNVIITGNSGLTMKNTAGIIQGISVNWAMGGNNDERAVAANATMPFTFRNPGTSHSLTIPSNITTLNPDQYWNGTALTTLASNHAQVMRFLISLRGTIIVQVGEVDYSTLAEAKDAAYTQTFTEILPKNTYAEIGRLAVRKGATSLTSLADASFFTTAGGGGGSSGGGADSLLTGYTIAGTASAVSSSDTISQGIGKVEKKANDNATAIANTITTDIAGGEQTKLSTSGNWSAATSSAVSVYTGTALSGNKQGQFYFDGLYLYFFVADDYPVRMVGNLNGILATAGTFAVTALDTATQNKIAYGNITDLSCLIPNNSSDSNVVLVKGTVVDVTEQRYVNDASSVPATGTFTYSYRLSSAASFTTGQTLAQLRTFLLTSDATRMVEVKAANTSISVPTTAVLTIKRYN